jgi:hypothetical protein
MTEKWVTISVYIDGRGVEVSEQVDEWVGEWTSRRWKWIDGWVKWNVWLFCMSAFYLWGFRTLISREFLVSLRVTIRVQPATHSAVLSVHKEGKKVSETVILCLCYVWLSVPFHFYFRTSWMIVTKFGMGVTPLETTPISCFSFPSVGNDIMVDARTSLFEATLL